MGADVELTLRPGESLPIDMIPLPPAVTMPYQKCGVRATSLHVGVNYWPRLEDDRRPRLSENDSGAFAGRTYSVRIRTRQIR